MEMLSMINVKNVQSRGRWELNNEVGVLGNLVNFRAFQ